MYESHAMKAPNITPGHWATASTFPFRVSCPLGNGVADCNASTGKSDVEKAANAQAIAAVPALLEALAAMRAEFGKPEDELDPDLSADRARILANSALKQAGYEF